MPDDSKAIWQAVDELRDRNSALEARMAAHEATHKVFIEEFRDSRRERKEQIDTIAHAISTRFAEFDDKLDSLNAKVTEAHGAAKFGKWLLAALTALAAIFYHKGS